MKIRIVPAIMSGGSGTRLWPLSTQARPKQFHALACERTMIQETVLRLVGEHKDVDFGPPIIIGNADQAELIETQLREIGIEPALIILEPVGRNTAATAALAAEAVRGIDPSALALLVPADHVIGDPLAFRDAIARGAAHARKRIVTFGLQPARAETGYGYIEAGEVLGEGVEAILSFTEKPNAAKAQTYIDAGNYYWNGGIFLFHPEVLLREFDRAPAIRDTAVRAFHGAPRQGVKVQLGADFLDTPSAPFDIAVMEATKIGAVVACDIGWADIGSWFELWRLGAEHETANVASGSVVALECDGSLIRAEGITIAASGLKDMIVVATPEAVLIVPKHKAQDVKKLWEEAQKLSRL